MFSDKQNIFNDRKYYYFNKDNRKQSSKITWKYNDVKNKHPE